MLLGLLLTGEQLWQCIASGRKRGLLLTLLCLLCLKSLQAHLGILLLDRLLLRSLLVLQVIGKSRESGHGASYIVKPYEFPPPE